MPTLFCFGREEEPINMLLLIYLKGKQNPIIMILSVMGYFADDINYDYSVPISVYQITS